MGLMCFNQVNLVLMVSKQQQQQQQPDDNHILFLSHFLSLIGWIAPTELSNISYKHASFVIDLIVSGESF